MFKSTVRKTTVLSHRVMNEVSAELVIGLLASGKTFQDISEKLKHLYPHISRGLSAQSVRRYAKEHSLKEKAENIVQEAVLESQVNEVY